jgi:uncharacterized membrane protein YccC
LVSLMMVLSERFKESFKLALAMVLAYGIALSVDWDKPMWAAFAVGVMRLVSAGLASALLPPGPSTRQ